jgi:thiamine-monophosphate kinase
MFQESLKKTNLSELGEFALIEKLTNAFTIKNNTTQKGIGDDAAVINIGKELVLISTDMLVEGIHFDLVYSPLKHLGFKAISTNVSDIAAMNGTAKQITISIAVSSKYTIEALEELYQGIWLAC